MIKEAPIVRMFSIRKNYDRVGPVFWVFCISCLAFLLGMFIELFRVVMFSALIVLMLFVFYFGIRIKGKFK